MSKVLTSKSGASFRPNVESNPINAKGQVAGSTQDGGHRRAAIFDTRTRQMRVLPTPSTVESFATDINGRGDVSGYIQDTVLTARAFLWSSRTHSLRLLNSLGGVSSMANGINDHGQVVGSVLEARSSYSGAVVWNTRTGVVRTLGGSKATAINNQGWVVGVANDPVTLNQRAVLWRPGGYALTYLPLLSNTDAGNARDINDSGAVVGEQFSLELDDLINRPVVWSGRALRACLLTNAEGNSAAYAINADGRVVGFEASYVNDTLRALTWKSCGRPGTTLPEIGGAGAAATGVNDRGLIIGFQYEGREQGVRWDRR